MFSRAICRKPGPDFAEGLTTSRLGRPDFHGLLRMHAAYVQALKDLHLEVDVLEPLPGYPDAYYVEDPAIITPEIGIITRPGAMERRGEEIALGAAIAKHRRTVSIQAPGTLEGGDVLFIGKQVFVGLSNRTNGEGVRQLASLLAPFGYSVTGIPVPAGLHFKSSVNWVGGDALLLSRDFANRPELKNYRKLIVPDDEIYATNTLWINGALIAPSGFPATRKLLDGLGMPIVELDCTEPMKMDGGLTCLSLRF